MYARRLAVSSWSRSRIAAFALATSFILAIIGSQASAAKYVVYLQGRSMNSWPFQALLAHSAAYTDITLAYNGSSRLGDATVRPLISNALSSYCSNGNQCVVACYSAGCLRYLLAIDDLKAAGTPATGVLWVQAAASAAGGSELADVSTNAGLRLLIKIFGVSGANDAAMIDWDLKIGSARGSLAFLQNGSPAPMYHTAGNQNICQRVKPSALSAGGLAINGANVLINGVWWANIGGVFGAEIAAGPIGWAVAITSFVFNVFSSTGVKLCGNSRLPGGYGDGAVPVHSAAGYADTGAHANHNDGGAKYLNRAYEQVPLFPVDHAGALGPMVQLGSIRLAVNKTAACANTALGLINDPDASIVYADADAARAVESTPSFLLNMCGASVLADPLNTSTCLGTNGCCTNFSTGSPGSCTCGETLCAQSWTSTLSYFSSDACAGTEYSVDNGTWDGNGMVGATATAVTIRSVRQSDGYCYTLTQEVTWSHGCPEFSPHPLSYSGKRVYRPGIASYGTDPGGANAWPGFVVASRDNPGTQCP
jgi:hypothetical protein